MSLDRIVVVGNSCSGKTSLSRALSQRLGTPHVELDSLYWTPDWTPATDDGFRRDVAEAIAGDHWIVDGNYQRVMDLVWTRATSLVWLDYPLALLMGRGLVRTVRRSLRREPLFAGNRESLRRAFFSHDSILLWILTSDGARRRRYREIVEQRRFPQLEVVRFTTPRATAAWLESVGRARV